MPSPAPSTSDHTLGLLTAAEALLSTAPARALELAREALAAPLDAPVEARARRCAGQALHHLAQFTEASTELECAAGLTRRAGDEAGEATTLVTLAKVSRELGELPRAERALTRALELARHTADGRLEADIRNQQAVLLQMGGHADAALTQFQAALALREALADDLGTAQVLSNIGQVHLSQSQHGQALIALNRASELLSGHHEPLLWAQCLMTTGHVYEDLDDWPQAYASHLRAGELGRAGGHRLVEMYALNNLAGAALQLGRPAEAQGLCEQTLRLATEVGQRYLVGVAHHGLGQALGGQARWDEALEHHRPALDIARELGDPGGEIDALTGLGEAQLRRGEIFAASQQLRAALPLAQRSDHRRAAARIHGLLAETFERSGDLQAALTHLRAQRDVEQRLAAEGRERQIRQLTVQFDVERTRHEAETERLRTEAAERAYVEAEVRVERRTRDLARTQVEVLTRLANAAEFRDDVTGEHTLRVGQVSALLAAQLGRPADEVALLRLAARLHDVGKIGISDLILLKPDRLTPEEFDRMKAHTVIGGQILAGGDSRLLRLAREIALHHHEQWGGGGYPQGHSGLAIPLSARIVAVADVYDALSHQRPYKRPWSQAEVLAELRRQSGQQFDPEVIAALEALHATGQLPLDSQHADDSGVQDVLVQLGVETGPGDVPAPAMPELQTERFQQLRTRYEQARSEISGLQVAAFTDALTGLGNRRAFESDLESAFAQAERHQRHLSVLSLDLDGLKTLNDTEGHDRGDALLITVGHGLQAAFETLGRLYRLGGDEFSLIVSWIGAPDTDDLHARLERGMDKVRLAGFVDVTASSGVATFPDEVAAAGDALRLSDQRMYRQKFARRRAAAPSALH